jgi:hypothetical protein
MENSWDSPIDEIPSTKNGITDLEKKQYMMVLMENTETK